MRFLEFIKFWIYHYFIIVCGFFFSQAVSGIIFWPDGFISYQTTLLVFAAAFFAALPTFILYSRKDLDSRQMLIRYMIHFIVLEAVVLGMGYFSNWYDTILQAVFIAVLVAVVYLVVRIVYWFENLRLANRINQKIRENERKKEEENE